MAGKGHDKARELRIYSPDRLGYEAFAGATPEDVTDLVNQMLADSPDATKEERDAIAWNAKRSTDLSKVHMWRKCGVFTAGCVSMHPTQRNKPIKGCDPDDRNDHTDWLGVLTEAKCELNVLQVDAALDRIFADAKRWAPRRHDGARDEDHTRPAKWPIRDRGLHRAAEGAGPVFDRNDYDKHNSWPNDQMRRPSKLLEQVTDSHALARVSRFGRGHPASYIDGEFKPDPQRGIKHSAAHDFDAFFFGDYEAKVAFEKDRIETSSTPSAAAS